MHPRCLAGVLASALSVGALAQTLPPDKPAPPSKGRFENQAPLPGLPSVILDTVGDGYGVAQQTAKAQGLQARILWIDATANISRYNSAEKIAALVDKAQHVGFNTLVLDVKPIVGFTLWPSKLAPRLTEWRGQTVGDFDPVGAMVTECRKRGLPLILSIGGFSEGHRDLGKGLGYDHAEWQSVLYEVDAVVQSSSVFKTTFKLASRSNQMPATDDQLGVFTDLGKLPAKLNGDSKVDVLDANGNVLAQADGAAVRALTISVPSGGSALVGIGRGAAYLRVYAKPDDRLSFLSTPSFVPIAQRPWQQTPLMVSPNSAEVQRHELDLLEELLRNYDVDGVLFDDRLRYAGLNADFGDAARSQFERFVGEKLTWPDDVFRWNVMPDLSRGIIPGKWYDAWLAFRAQTLRDFVVEARKTAQRVRPRALFGVYAGSWFGEYSAYGANYAASEFEAGFRFLSPAYQKAGFGDQLDVLITGCYYPTGTIAEAMALNDPVGYTVEAAGQLSNRTARDQAWVYAGISVENFRGDQNKLRNALQAAVASTQGVMVFDLSHDLDKLWHVFQQAFALKAKAPHTVAGLLAEVRHKRAQLDKSGVKDPPVTINTGQSGAGF